MWIVEGDTVETLKTKLLISSDSTKQTFELNYKMNILSESISDSINFKPLDQQYAYSAESHTKEVTHIICHVGSFSYATEYLLL